jgi:DNA processing protein
MSAVVFDVDDPRLAAAAWSRIAEPADEVAGALVQAWGASGALRWLLGATPPGSPREREYRALAVADRNRIEAARTRWQPRLATLDPRRELRVLSTLGGSLLLPDDQGWPLGLDRLGAQRPACLWVRGCADLAGLLSRSIALVGSRAASDYGEHVASEMAGGLADLRFVVLSGGAYGIDAAAHRGALAADGATVVVLAGGVDRSYPAGNATLIERAIEAGAVISEVPPGSVPSRSRFLTRNRLIAAATGATVVVEAAHRSGALNTANHASRLFRPLGAVPGPVTSVSSAGCHQLIRAGAAVCVTNAAEAAELAGTLGDDLAPEVAIPGRPEDDLTSAERLAFDALPLRRPASLEALARSAGLGDAELLSALGTLELRQLALNRAGQWMKSTKIPGQNG